MRSPGNGGQRELGVQGPLWQKMVVQLKEADDTDTVGTCEIRLDGRQ